MGNALPPDNIDFLLETYHLIEEQDKLKILQDKQTGQRFALLEQCFVNRQEYDRNFKKLTNRSNNLECQNILQLVKMWSKQHNGICSNVFKIYRVYEYPKVRLIDEIEARGKENKMFEEVQLFSILQSCLNALTVQPQYINLSPYMIFILPEGMLKLTHKDLLDPNARTMYNQLCYYSPEKVECFQKEQQSNQELQKEAVFSLGMTLLHSALLKSLKSCYQISFKRFKSQKLEVYLEQVKDNFSPVFFELLASMLTTKPENRVSMEGVQDVVSTYFSNSTSMFGSKQSNQKIEDSIKLTTHQQDKVNEFSLIYSGQTFHRVSQSSLGLHSYTKKTTEVDFTLENSKRIDLPKNHHVLQKTKKIKICEKNDKENLYTDPKLIELIKSGMSKISKSQEPSYFTLAARDSESTNQAINQSQVWKDPFGQYELATETKDKEKSNFMSQTYEDKSYFEGMVQGGMKNGYGRLVYPDGVYYEGNFKNDTLEGKGSLFYGKDRPAYVGDWGQNKFHGIGILFNEFPLSLKTGFDYRDFNRLGDCWVKYEGEFKEDVKQGWGKIVLTNTQTMEGPFLKGLLNGNCVFTTVNGLKIEGIWKDNVMIVN